MTKRKPKFKLVGNRSKAQQLKELKTALESSRNGRKEEDIPEDDVYWKVKDGLGRLQNG